MKKVKAWRKSTTLLIALTLFLGILAGCTSSGKDESSQTAENNGKSEQTGNGAANGNAPKKPAKFTYLRPVWGPATLTKGGAYEKELFSKANVDIDVQIVPVSEYDTKVNTIIASGNIPDVLWGQGPTDKKFREMQEQGAFLDLVPYLEKYPELKKLAPDALWEQLKDKDGHIFFLPNSGNPFHPMMNFYRKDWFDEIGIKEPTTTQELEQALEKVKEAKKDVVPLTGQDMLWGLGSLATSFGFVQYGWQPDAKDPGKLVPFYMTEGARKFQFWLKDLRKKGLLDPEFLVNKDWAFAKSKFIAGKAAVLGINWGYAGEVLASVKKTDPNAVVGILPPLTGPDGAKGGVRLLGLYDRGIYVSSKMKNPDDFFAFLNWTFTEGTDFRRYGVEGKTYKLESEKKIGIPNDDREADYKDSQIEPYKFVDRLSEKLDWEQIRNNFEGQGLADQFDMYKSKFEEYAATIYPDYRSPLVVSPTEVEKGTQIYNDYLMKVVEGGAVLDDKVTEQTWNDAVNRWLGAGGEQIIKEVNELQTDKSKPNVSLDILK